MATPTEPDDNTTQAERKESSRSHSPDRPATSEEERAADERTASQSEEDRRRVEEHEAEMAERGVHQQGEGKIE